MASAVTARLALPEKGAARDLPAAGVSDYQFEARQRSQIPSKFPLWGASAPMEEGRMCRRDARGSRSAGAGC